jgi:Na+-transporting NADH:ubiquinone oxidoreductase subunit B
MNALRKQLDALKRPFGKGQKLEKFAPAINAFDTFLFVPNHTTKKGAHIRDAIDLKRTMVTVIIALLPALIYGIYNTGYQYYIQTNTPFTFIDAFIHGAWKIIPMIIVSYVVGLSIEFGFAVYRGHEVNEGYLVTGLLIPMIMPVDIPLWMVGISTAFAVLIAKEAFGGTGMNILNPALTARAFAFFAYPTYMSGNKVWVSEAGAVDGISGGDYFRKFSCWTRRELLYDGNVPRSYSRFNCRNFNTLGSCRSLDFNSYWYRKLEDHHRRNYWSCCNGLVV